MQVFSAILCAAVLPDGLHFYCMAFGKQRFCLLLSNIDFKFSLRIISPLDKNDVHLIGQHCPIHPSKVSKVHAAWHLLHSSSVIQEYHLLLYEVWWKLANVSEEANSSFSTIKMEEPTTSNFVVEKKKGWWNSTRHMVSQQTTSAFTDPAMRTSNITQTLIMTQAFSVQYIRQLLVRTPSIFLNKNNC